ncbi:uncharacterized protein YALI1_C30058g [Yarrowia lipolytica]|uniref:Uncharacterized protein n=1 Tax=Yarrowia lipolytica TaxID=4952 RepID=A0A1D8NC65_YARLL|nr:hypothetical protein YALI1_C30058g [Yarrowia lipolytica]
MAHTKLHAKQTSYSPQLPPTIPSYLSISNVASNDYRPLISFSVTPGRSQLVIKIPTNQARPWILNLSRHILHLTSYISHTPHVLHTPHVSHTHTYMSHTLPSCLIASVCVVRGTAFNSYK